MADCVLEEFPARGLAVLRVLSPELDIENRLVFARAVAQLLKSEQPRLVVDLTMLRQIFSIYIGSLVDLHRQASEQGKPLWVLISPGLSKVFDNLSLAKMLKI